MTYSEKLKDPRWQKKRLKIMERDGWKCRRCPNDKVTLNVHHLKYLPDHEPWDYPDELLVTLCEPCHEKEHSAARPKKREVLDWPLGVPGDERFFGYIIGLGFQETDPMDEDAPLNPYACFSYNGSESVVMLPNDSRLFSILAGHLESNFESLAGGGGMIGKLWIKKLDKGYQVDLP